MAPLATAFIRLRTDSSQLNADVRRDASRAGTTGGTVMGREFGTAFRRVSRTLIGLGIGTFAAEAGRFAISMADKFELSRSRLETVTKNLGGNFADISSQVQALDNRLAAFGFTNADVEGSVASLESATKSQTKAMKDAALAADIARGRNISLEAATQILMRVETGHVAMLSRLGIATKDANGHLLTQQEALKQLAALYGGSASRFAGTFAGKQQALRAELGNTASEIGVALLPAAVDLAHVLQHDVLPPLQSSVEFFDRNRRAIEPLVGALIKLTLAYKAMRALGRVTSGLTAGRAVSAESSLAHPVPVYVVNWKGGGVFAGGKAVSEAETAAVEEATLRSRVGALLPKLGRNVLRGFIIETVAQALGDVVGGKTGHFIGNVGKGAGAGAVFGPEGAVAGGAAVVAGAGINAGLNAAQNALAPSNAESKVIQQLMANGQGAANLARLQQIAASQRRTTGQVPREVQQEIDGLTAALNRQKTAAGAASTATKAETAALLASGHAASLTAKSLAYLQAKGIAVSQSQDDVRSAIHNLAVTAAQGGRALQGNSDAALANRDALRNAVQAAESYIQTLKQHHASARTVAITERGLAQAIKQSADNTYGDTAATRKLLRELGYLPSQIDAVTTAILAMNAAWNPITGSEHPGISDFKVPDLAGIKKAVNDVTKSVTQGMSHVETQAEKDAADAAKRAFEQAKSRMQSDVQSVTQFFRQEKTSLVSAFATISTTGTDLLGASGAANVNQQLKQGARQMDVFAHLWDKLHDLHLDPMLLDQFAGPDYIPAMRQILASGRKGIRQDNRSVSRIRRDARGIAGVATADKFDRRIHEDLTVVLPNKLAKAMSREIPHAISVHLDVTALDHREGVKVQQS